MTIDNIRSSLLLFARSSGFELQLIRVSSIRHKTVYANCSVKLTPTGALDAFVKELIKSYTEGEASKLAKYTSVTEYDGTAEQTIIYSLASTNQLVADEYSLLIQSMAEPETEAKVVDFKADAYVISGTIDDDEGNEIAIKLFSMQKPVSRMKNRFWLSGNTFKKIEEPVLNMRMSIDVLMIDKEIFFFNMSGENLFNMERSYKALCTACSQDVVDSALITNSDVFKSVAASGANPRRFVSFDKERLEKLKDADMRKKMAAKFKIDLNDADLFMTEDKATAEKLIKLLCKKGMVDPFGEEPVEVSGARLWQ